MEIMNIAVRREISAATSTGTTSISAENAPACSGASVCRQTSSAELAELPTALNPPVQVRLDGISPTCPQTGTPSSRNRLIVPRLAAQ